MNPGTRRDRATVPPAQRRPGRGVRPPRPLVAARLGQSSALRLCRPRVSGQSQPQRDLGRAVLSRSRRAAGSRPTISRSSRRRRPRCRVLRDGAAAGARSATLYAAGFGEGGDETGLRLAAQAARACSRRPASPSSARTAWASPAASPASAPSRTRPCRSSRQARSRSSRRAARSAPSINRAVNELGLKIAYFASCGGQIGCKVSDFIDYFADQPELRVILCYIEAIPDAAHFLDAARRARANGKTVVAVKIGGSESARAFALAHTGSLAGSVGSVRGRCAAAAGVVRLADARRRHRGGRVPGAHAPCRAAPTSRS